MLVGQPWWVHVLVALAAFIVIGGWFLVEVFGRRLVLLR
jgi:hypothetical protein